MYKLTRLLSEINTYTGCVQASSFKTARLTSRKISWSLRMKAAS
jgi:hypothetical protein